MHQMHEKRVSIAAYPSRAFWPTVGATCDEGIQKPLADLAAREGVKVCSSMGCKDAARCSTSRHSTLGPFAARLQMAALHFSLCPDQGCASCWYMLAPQGRTIAECSESGTMSMCKKAKPSCVNHAECLPRN